MPASHTLGQSGFPADFLTANPLLRAVHDWLAWQYDLKVVQLNSTERNKTTEYESIGVELNTQLVKRTQTNSYPATTLPNPATLAGVLPATVQYCGGNASLMATFIAEVVREEAPELSKIEIDGAGTFWVKFKPYACAPENLRPLNGVEEGLLLALWTRCLQLNLMGYWQSPWIIQGKNQQQRTREEKAHLKAIYEQWLLEVLHEHAPQHAGSAGGTTAAAAA